MDNNPGISIFQATGLNIENPSQNQEEDEDVEEQKRRQEEIHNFLTTAMDEFNYDEQSTINSSENVSVDDAYSNQSIAVQKYKTSNLDDQLKVLYDIRVKEVKSLMEQLDQLKTEIQKQKEVNGKTVVLLEAEKDRAKISSQQAQALLVTKTEEISKLRNEIETLRNTIMSLEATVMAVNEEYTLSKQTNKELLEQLSLMHNGLTTNTISDRQLQEQHHAEVSQLHHLLDSAHMKLHRKEKEFKEVEQKLKETLNDKDTLMSEKAGVINQLTQNLENALHRCQEFSGIIEKISEENKTLKLSTTTNDLTESIKSMGLSEKTEIVKVLQRELEKSRGLQNEQKIELESLRETCHKLTKDCDKFETNNDQYKNELEMWKKKYVALDTEFSRANEEIKFLKLQLEDNRQNLDTVRKTHETKIKLLEETLENYKNRENQDSSVQVSLITDNLNTEIVSEENEKLKNKIDALNAEVEFLNKKVLNSENHLSQMKLKMSLEKERETLIKCLQEKAAKFEEIIKRKQVKPNCVSAGVNTDNVVIADIVEQTNLLKTKYETDLVQKEIEIRMEVKRDFDIKLEKIQQDLSKKMYQLQEKNCDNCQQLLNSLRELKIATDTKDNEIGVLRQQMKHDREAVATLLEEWSGKFVHMENEKKELYTECTNLQESCDQLILKLGTKEAGDSKVYELIKKECEETIKTWNKNILHNLNRYTLAQKESINQSHQRIQQCCNNTDIEIEAIEAKYLNKKQLIEQSVTQKNTLKYRTFIN
ncbi:hypothetical protein QE152_g38220 [Popillia japonica]|uniref:Uncharacterized protein n=1 Tax=Popillia japonica TaxID=7064 RepID=A0AAW1I6U3_POPJA